MGGARLLRRRLGAHPVAVAAILVSVLASLVVVTGLQLLSGAITDAGIRSGLDVPAADRSVVASASLRPGDLTAVDAAVRGAAAGLPGASVTRVGTATTRGLPDRAATDRALLADVDGIRAAAALTDGRWPARPSDAAARGRGRVEVALPGAAADALSVGLGDTVELADLVDDDAPNVTVVVVGLFRPRSPDDALWADLPLALSGVTESDFTTYGPFVVAPGTFDGPLVGASTVTWRTTADVAGMTAARLPAFSRAVDATVRDLRRVLGLPVEPGSPDSAEPTELPVSSPRVATDLPALLASAALVGDRIHVALLTPTVLLVLLGAVALVGAAALLAALRDAETRLLRTRGASGPRLAALALGDAVVVAALGVAGAVLLAPVVSRTLTGGSGPAWRPADLRDADLWRVLLPLALLAVVVTVGTTLWVGRSGGARASSRARSAGLRLAAGSGLDLVLVALGAVAAVQLRRYDAAGATTVDPLTAAAPALVVAGLAVVCLRLLPWLARLVARWGERRWGLDLAWGGWQFSRRAAAQSGTLLLVLLAAGMGTIALGHSATVDRAVADQSAFESGAPLRVVRGFGAGADRTAPLVASAVGGSEHVMPVWRGDVDLGAVEDVTVLAVDTAVAPRVMDPRPDTVEGDGSWPAVVGELTAARDLGGGLPVPEGTERLTVVARMSQPVGGRFDPEAGLRLRDGRGIVHAVSVGRLSTSTTRLTADLSTAGLQPPVTLVGVAAPLPAFARFVGDGTGPTLEVTTVEADGRPLGGLDRFTDESTVDAVWWAADPGPDRPVPAVVTPDVARAVASTGSAAVTLALGPREVPIEVAGVVDVLPTAARPTRGILLDLPTLGAAPVTVGGGSTERSRAVFEPSEWWAGTDTPTAAARAVRAEAAYGTTVVDRAALVRDRLQDPVNSGMRAAMLLVTLASVLLAAVGFAASTAALGRTRRHENAVLLALGMPPGRIRTVLLVERALVVAVTVVVGLVLGAVAALVVVPLLVGGDGHPQVPPVRVDLPLGQLAGYVGVLLLALAVVGALVLRSSVHDLAGRLREGEPQ